MNGSQTSCVLFLGTLLIACLVVRAQEPQGARSAAPSLGKCTVGQAENLGLWENVFVPPDQDFLVARRGEDIYTLPMDGLGAPAKLVSSRSLGGTEIVFSHAVGKELWLLLNSSQDVPSALEARSGRWMRLEIPGLNVPGEQAPAIQSVVFAPQSQAVVLMVSGGDRSTWPREGSRPLYFWVGLKLGLAKPFPAGWDLDYFSADLNVAVFSKPSEVRFERRPLQAIDMKTGEPRAEVPDRRSERCAPFDWTEKRNVRPLALRRAATGDTDHFAGLALPSGPVFLELEAEAGRYLAQARSVGRHFAFRLRREGGSIGEPRSLWRGASDSPTHLERITEAANDFALFEGGDILYRTTGHGRRGDSHEVWFRPIGAGAAWNLLDGLERLPPLPDKFAKAEHVVDQLSARLIENFGSEKGKLALCLATHARGDRLARVLPAEQESVEWQTWQRCLVVTGVGRRFETPLFREGRLPDEIWVHVSGRIVTGDYQWRAVGERRERRVRLTGVMLELPP